MTDIQRHLKGIRKILAKAMDQPFDLQRIHADLRAFLPRSYGIGGGQIIGEAGASASVPLLIYDVPLSGGIYSTDSTTFRIEHVLLILHVSAQHSTATLRDVLDMVRSVKQLQTFRPREPRPETLPPGQARRTIPKDRLPFALVYFNALDTYPPHDTNLFEALYRLMSGYSVDVLPDQIDILSQAAQYLNPLLEADQPDWFAVGWSRTPDRREPELCYVCKQKYFRRHFRYDSLCLRCGDLNFQKRIQSLDLSGYRFLVTGARIKIGFATGLRLLRAGAEVIATSRFPRDTARRYAQEPDFSDWRDRLHIYGSDLRQIPRLEAFARYLDATYPYLDGVINNAAQTVKRPAAFYAHLLPFERAAEVPALLQPLLDESLGAEHLQSLTAGYLSGGHETIFPPGQYDDHGQQIDNRAVNSWVMELEEISPAEMVEVHLVNAVAPAVLAGQLKPVLMRSPHTARFIVNVSAAEGRFTQGKSARHPHTNMAKAALNMLTRTIADRYAEDRIYVTSVDPGWVSDQMPRTSETSRDQAQLLPIDIVDAASRVCDPIFCGVRGDKPIAGKLLKDYEAVSW